MSLIAARLEPASGFYATVKLEFSDRPARRIIFAGLEHAVDFHERAERLVQGRADWTTCFDAAQTHPGFVRAWAPTDQVPQGLWPAAGR